MNTAKSNMQTESRRPACGPWGLHVAHLTHYLSVLIAHGSWLKAHSSKLVAHSSKLIAHSSKLIAHSSLLLALFLPAVAAAAPENAAAPESDASVDFFHHIYRDFQRRRCWPEPFIYQDREMALAPYFTMVSRGWELQNMLADHHFLAGTTQLTEAGRLKIYWILMEAPPQHRVIYVHRSLRPEETIGRVEAVRQNRLRGRTARRGAAHPAHQPGTTVLAGRASRCRRHEVPESDARSETSQRQ